MSVRDAAGFKALQDAVKERRRELAKKYHPDRGGDPERMKRINAAVDYVMMLKWVAPPPSPGLTVRRVHIYASGATTNYTYTWTSGGSSTSWGG